MGVGPCVADGHGQGAHVLCVADGAPTPETGCTVQRRDDPGLPKPTLKNRTACMADLLRYSIVIPTTDVRSATRFRLTTFTELSRRNS